jgi:hypothetical protein
MKTHIALAAVAALASAVWTSRANAQVVVAHENVAATGPNRALLHSGLFTFGVPYIASIAVAATSDHPGDNNLYIPVVGPWMDLADRGGCGGVLQRSCDGETANKVLLVADGILQGFGALDIVGAFLFPETRVVADTSKPHVAVSPAYLGRETYGLTAVGTF